MELEDIIQELDRRFDLPLREYYERRIIFWQDPEGEFREEIAGVKLQNAKVLVLTGRNAFLAKKLLSHDDQTSNYLVYGSKRTGYSIWSWQASRSARTSSRCG